MGGARSSKIAQLIRYEYTRPGKEIKVYNQWLVHESTSVLVLYMPKYEGSSLTIEGEPAIDPGGSILWYVFPGAWHDIGRFYLSDTTPTGWYTNLCTPVERDGDNWFCTDLFLDHWISSSGNSVWLDEKEFNDACKRDLLTKDQQTSANREREYIQNKIDVGNWPPNSVGVMDLERAKQLVGI